MKPIIALDADGVLLDYNLAYRRAWDKAFNTLPSERDPLAYWPIDRWDVLKLEGNELAHFRAYFDQQFWSEIPAISGAVEACLALRKAGYQLVCVSAMDKRYEAARLKNLRDCGFPIERVIVTESLESVISPKAAALRELHPVAFVDDYLPYLRGIPNNVHAALVLREPNGSPNVGPDLMLAHSQHADLIEFSRWWLDCRGPVREFLF
ncbi:HAD family hydrolase [Undibacterium terreum]|uniref:Phosphate acetyltransferase n=1 Tax=Undibacterium terreum TaxID=1224302 RepID=A0A916URF5_9BURK|nr:HAD family hydrolase [Undibacterium terreum]GGC83616.1 hypothetical protein GCM10011396_33780 [Undibacterium terreum]